MKPVAGEVPPQALSFGAFEEIRALEKLWQRSPASLRVGFIQCLHKYTLELYIVYIKARGNALP
jgi:hypothetical protein